MPADDDALHLTWSFDAPPDRVFAAWVEPDRLVRWAWGDLARDARATVDLRPGGPYRITTERADGTTWAFSGSYVVVEPPARLVYTVAWDAPMGYTSPGETVEVRFTAGTAGGTDIAFTHAGIPEVARAEHRAGWENTFAALAALLAAG